MLTCLHSHSSLGAISTANVIYIWNQKNPDKRISIIVMALLGGFVARIPDWDIYLNKEMGWNSVNMAHRSVYSHSILGVFLFGLAFVLVIYTINQVIKKFELGKLLPNKIISIALSASVLSHVVSDSLEDYPTRVFYPFTKDEFYGFIPTSFFHDHDFIVSLWIIAIVSVLALDIIDKKKIKRVQK